MSDQMGTLGGIVSNLKDSFTEFLLVVAESGPLEEFKLLVKDLAGATGDKDGLAKTLSKTLVRAIKALRRALKGDLINTLKTVAEALAFAVENFDKLILLFGAAKTFQAFNAIASGFRTMGIAAGASLGPIGAIASALMLLIPIALDVGKELDGVFRKKPKPPTAAEKKEITSREFVEFTEEANEVQATIRRERGIIAADAGAASVQGAEKRLAVAVKKKSLLEEKARKSRKAAREKSITELGGDQFPEDDFAAFDADVANVRKGLGMTGEAGNAKQKKGLERATLARADGKSLKEARKAAGLDRKGGGRRSKKKEKEESAKITSPVSISEFLGASGRGELGALASRTPSTGDIEPTVAIDITNNTFTFSDTFNIEGKGDPVETGKQVVLQIKAEFDRRLGNAGQQMATNVVR